MLTDFSDAQSNTTTLSYDTGHRLTTVTEPGGRTLTIHYASISSIPSRFSGSLAYITSTPSAGWNQITGISASATRYLRYVGPYGGHSDIAEIEFYDSTGALIPGTPFGTGPASATGHEYDKALDGNTSTYADIADPDGGYEGLDLGSGTVPAVNKIRYFPRAGHEGQMAPSGGSYGVFVNDTIFPISVQVISQVDSSDGRSVVYNYSNYADSTMPYNYEVLGSVSYDDSTVATYTYGQIAASTTPLVFAFDDPRYVSGALNKERVSYYTNSIAGAVKEQKGYDGTVITTIGLRAADIHYPTATYANGGVDTYDYWGSAPFGMQSAHIDKLGRTTSYGYDSNHFLNSVTDPLGHTVNYVKSIYDNPTQITHPDSTTESWTRDSRDLPLTYTDERGNTTTWTRDSFHRITRVDYPDSSYETFTYNSLGKVLTHLLRNGGTETFTYSTTGLMLTKVDAESHTWSYAYDSHDRLASLTDPNSHSVAFTYNLRGLVTQVTYADSSTRSYTYNAYGKVTSTTDELGHTTSYSYDQYQRMISFTDPLSRQVQTVYRNDDYMEVPSQIILPSGKTTAFTYDLEWNCLTKTVAYGSSDAATISYSYDGANNVVTTTDPRGKIWSSTYDSRNRKLANTDPLTNTISYSYDGANNILTVTRPDGSVTTNVYDVMNRLTTSTDPKSQVTTFAYDNADNLASITDARSKTYSYTYDNLNRRLSMSYPGGSAEFYAYDPVGNLLTYTNRAGDTTTYTYDNRNRETFINYSALNTPDVTKTYDVAGRQLTAVNSAASYVYTYDNANELLSETTTYPSVSPAFTVTYTYNADGNRNTLTNPDGSVVSYSYTNRNQVKEIEADGPPPLATYTYDLNGNRSSKILENGTVASYIYDNASRLTQVKHVKSSTTIAQFDYTLDNVGNMTAKNASGVIPNVNESYSYDAVDQVTGATKTGDVQSFAYDATGNRTAVTSTGGSPGVGTYVTNALNQYTGVGSDLLLYDSKGNLVTQGLTANYSYDSKSRLLGATKGSDTMSVVYDYRNRPVSRTINGTTTYLVYDNWSLIAEYDASGTLLQKYVHGSQLDEILAKIDSSGSVYYHQDGLDSTVTLTDTSGNLLESYQYDVFGAVKIFNNSGSLIATSAFGNRFLFTGRELIKEVNTYDYRNRTYSTDLGRFLQTDPIRFAARDINVYRYCGNNAVNLVDPSGLCPKSDPKPGGDSKDGPQQEDNSCVPRVVTDVINRIGNGGATEADVKKQIDPKHDFSKDGIDPADTIPTLNNNGVDTKQITNDKVISESENNHLVMVTIDNPPVNGQQSSHEFLVTSVKTNPKTGEKSMNAWDPATNSRRQITEGQLNKTYAPIVVTPHVK